MIDSTIINPYYRELKKSRPIEPLPEIEVVKLNKAEYQTEQVFGLMDDYGIKYRKKWGLCLIDYLADNDNRLTIDMLNRVIHPGPEIDGQVGRIIIDHINNGVYNIHSFNNLEWHGVEE